MSNGGALVSRSFRSFAVNDGLVAKVVEAIKLGDAEARKRSKIKSFEVFIIGNRQNLVIGQVLVIPPQVADSVDTFPIALLYGAMCKELSPEANADILSYRLGESEFDEYSQKDMSDIKDRLFKDAQGKFRSIVLFLPSWANPRNYVLFKFVKDENLLRMFVRHQIFAAYFDPALSSSFNQLTTEVDTSKFDVTDITPKLIYPFLSESPFKSYPNLRDDDLVDVKMASGKKAKIFLAAETFTDDIKADFLEPGEKKTLDQLSKDLRKGIEGEVTAGVDLKTTNETNEGLRSRPDYGSPESYAVDMNSKNSSKTAADRIQTYPAWKRKVKAMFPEATFEGDIDICQAFSDASKENGVGEWEGSYGEVYPVGDSPKFAGSGTDAKPQFSVGQSVYNNINKTERGVVEKVDGTYVHFRSPSGKLFTHSHELVSPDTSTPKKADSVAEDTNPDTSRVGQDVDKEIPVAPAIAEVALDAVLASKTAGANTKYTFGVEQVGRDSWKWSIEAKGPLRTKVVATGTASSQKEASDAMRAKLDDLRGVGPDGLKKEASVAGVKASDMDPWIAAGLGLTADQRKVASEGKVTKTTLLKAKTASTKVSGKDVVLAIDGCILSESPAGSGKLIALSDKGDIDTPKFDGARIVWDHPEDFPASFRMAVEKHIKKEAKIARKRHHTAEVLTDVDDILSDITEEIGPAPVADVKEAPAEKASETTTSDASETTTEKAKEDTTEKANESDESKTASFEDHITVVGPDGEIVSEDFEGKPFTNESAEEYAEAMNAELKDEAVRIEQSGRGKPTVKSEYKVKYAATSCQYCGSRTNSPLGICQNCEDSMECVECEKPLNGSGESWTEIRPDIFAHESCMEKAKAAKLAAFNMYIPGQVLENFYPELLHETVEYPNDSNSPMIDNAVIASALDHRLGYISTSPAPAMGLGRDGKPQVLDGVPLRKEVDIRGFGFEEEYHGQREMLNPGSLHAASALFSLNKKAGKEENKAQFIDFLKKVVGEVAATFLAAFKVTNRGVLTDVPGVGEILLAQVEQPAGTSAFNTINTGSRVSYLLAKMNDTDLQDALNEAWAKADVYNDSPNGGFVYEVFVRGQSIDVDSMVLKYEYVIGSRGV